VKGRKKKKKKRKREGIHSIGILGKPVLATMMTMRKSRREHMFASTVYVRGKYVRMCENECECESE